MIGESWHACIPCELFYIEQGRPGVLTMRLHGKTGISGWKNKINGSCLSILEASEMMGCEVIHHLKSQLLYYS